MMRTRGTLLLVAIAASIAGITYVALRESATVLSPNRMEGVTATPLEPDEVATHQGTSEEWLSEVSRQPVVLEVVDPSGTREIHAEGRLDPESKAALQASLRYQAAQLYQSWEAKCLSGPPEADGSRALPNAIEEMEALVLAKRAEAAADLLASDKYMTCPAGTGQVADARLPPGYVPIRSYNAGLADGELVDVLIPVPPDHPAVRPVMEELQIMRGVQRDQELTAFNALPEAERRQRIEAHISATETIRNVRNNALYQAHERQALFSGLMKDLLPGRWGYTSDYRVFRKQ